MKKNFNLLLILIFVIALFVLVVYINENKHYTDIKVEYIDTFTKKRDNFVVTKVRVYSDKGVFEASPIIAKDIPLDTPIRVKTNGVMLGLLYNRPQIKEVVK